MKGKERCRILKEIRQRIAEENGIEFVTSECRHKGDCRGTCPKCESEVRYLERELERRRRIGKSVAVAGVAMGIALTSLGCAEVTVDELQGDTQVSEPGTANTITDETVEGLIAVDEGCEDGNGDTELEVGEVAVEDELMGEPVIEDYELAGAVPTVDQFEELTGDVATFFPETPDGFEGYDAEFIQESLSGYTIDDIKAQWGTPDMYQEKDSQGIIGYFTEARDIVIQYDAETHGVLNVTTISNE